MNRYESTGIESRPRQVPSGTLLQVLAKVENNLQFDAFDDVYIEQAKEICLIIAEVFILPPMTEIQINGNKLTAESVQVVFDMLTHEDIISVMDNFEAASYKIRHKKTYLRTALYNEVFERSSRTINGIRTDIPEYSITRKEQVMMRSARNGKIHT